jgi:hypothetical protein
MINEIAIAREARKGRDIEREMDAAVIRDSVLAGSSAHNFKLLREFKTAAQSFVDMYDSGRAPMTGNVTNHVEWFRELLK